MSEHIKFTIRTQRSNYALTQLIVLFTLSTPILLGLITLFVSTIIDHGLSSDFFGIILLILFLAYFSLFMFNYILWQIRGSEEIEMDSNALKVVEKGKIINHTRLLLLQTISSIEEQNYETISFLSSIWRNPFLFSKIIGENGGRIVVRYGNKGKKTIEFGIGLTPQEATRYVTAMNALLTAARDKQVSSEGGPNA